MIRRVLFVTGLLLGLGCPLPAAAQDKQQPAMPPRIVKVVAVEDSLYALGDAWTENAGFEELRSELQSVRRSLYQIQHNGATEGYKPAAIRVRSLNLAIVNLKDLQRKDIPIPLDVICHNPPVIRFAWDVHDHAIFFIQLSEITSPWYRASIWTQKLDDGAGNRFSSSRRLLQVCEPVGNAITRGITLEAAMSGGTTPKRQNWPIVSDLTMNGSIPTVGLNEGGHINLFTWDGHKEWLKKPASKLEPFEAFVTGGERSGEILGAGVVYREPPASSDSSAEARGQMVVALVVDKMSTGQRLLKVEVTGTTARLAQATRDSTPDNAPRTRSILAALPVAISVPQNTKATKTMTSSPDQQKAQRCFFTADDGRTWFAGSADSIPQCEIGGRLAVRAFVFASPNNPSAPFVAYLMEYDRAAKDALQQAKAEGRSPTPEEQKAISQGTLVKRPGDRKWIPLSEAADITTVHTPGGQPVLIVPTE